MQRYVDSLGAEIEATANFMEILKAGKKTIEDELSDKKGSEYVNRSRKN